MHFYANWPYGKCWSVSGLKLVLYMETTEYLSGISNGFGARLTIHAPNTLPLPSEEGMFIPSSMETSIGMKMVSQLTSNTFRHSNHVLLCVK